MKKINEKVLHFIETLRSTGVINYDQDFLTEVGILKQRLYQIKKDNKNFTFEHIQKISDVYNLNPNWLFDKSNEMFLKSN